MDVITIEVPQVGNRTHLVHDGENALVIDPPRDLEIVEEAAELAGVRIAAVADTHVHNDYVSGALGLARRHGVDYLLSVDERVAFDRAGVRDGDVVDVGSFAVHVIDTPGHTLHHQALLATDGVGRDALFSGGSLLAGTVGRTDLMDPLLARHLARAQWNSVRHLGTLDPATSLHPTHGFGSFCAATSTSATDVPLSIGGELASNHALNTPRDAFVDELVAGFGPVPTYYRRMSPANRAGRGTVAPRVGHDVGHDDVLGVLARGGWAIDLRSRESFAEGHLSGSVNVEYGAQFATWVGWLTSEDTEIVLLTDDPGDLTEARRDLERIGIEGTHARVLVPGVDLPSHPTLRRAAWSGLADAPADRVLVDVRHVDEYDDGHLPDAIHIPLHHLETRLHELPAGEVWVRCLSGYRAGIAASLLQRAGRSVVHIDDVWENAPVETTRGQAA